MICNISAWNYPWLVGVNVFVSALLAGNSVMYKPSEYATLTGMEIEKLLKQSGIPDDVFQLALGGKSVGEAFSNCPLTDIFLQAPIKPENIFMKNVHPKWFPASWKWVEKIHYMLLTISAISHRLLKQPQTAHFIITDKVVVRWNVFMSMKISMMSFFFHFKKVVESWKTGAPTEAGVYFGPLTRKQQLAVLENQVADAVQKGAQLLMGGKRTKGKGYYFDPTILADTTHEMLVMKEESFGPVIGIMRVKNDEEAVSLMSDTEYGLTAAVYTANRARAEKILARLNTGSGYWNCCDRVSAALPWSGRNHSGFGTTLSRAGMQSFVRPKAWHLRK